MNRYDKGLMWFRRDLRAEDNAALHHALSACRQVWCVFVFDTEILDPLTARGLTADRRVEFIRESVVELDERLRALGRQHGHAHTGLIVRHARAREAIPALAARLGVQAVFANHDDDPAAKARDAQVFGGLAHAGIMFHGYKDHVIFERRELLTRAGGVFSVFTPYRKAWLNQLGGEHLRPWPVAPLAAALAPLPGPVGGEWNSPVPRLSDLDFTPTNLSLLPLPCGSSGAQRLLADFIDRIGHYHEARDFPAVKGPSYLGAHLRFGTVSIREVASIAHRLHGQGIQGASTWLDELIWRDFFHQILANHPHVVSRAFKPAYDRVRFEHGRHAQALFEAWRQGRTGYPLVDAAMAQLKQTGYMHNRLRMLVASFLVKDLGLHWRWGEQHFADHLIDYELASNNGGWQWAAGTGCDAAPYFRVFNPWLQTQKFDPQQEYLRRWIPEIDSSSYPEPVVEHKAARLHALKAFKKALEK